MKSGKNTLLFEKKEVYRLNAYVCHSYFNV